MNGVPLRRGFALGRRFARALLAIAWCAAASLACAQGAPCPTATRTEPIDGGTIAYNVAGAGPTVLLIHGLFADKEQWGELACRFADAGYRAIAVDLPGYGGSDGFPLSVYQLEHEAQALHTLMQRLDVDRVNLAGNSMGGAIAALYASRYPRSVRSLAFLGSPLGIAEWAPGIREAIFNGVAGHLLHVENAAEVAPIYVGFLRRTVAGQTKPHAGAAAIEATFACDGGKRIDAVFVNGPASSVTLALSDGRSISLPQAPSASGARYANGNESFVFWSKGDTAFIEENGKTTYSGCTTR